MEGEEKHIDENEEQHSNAEIVTSLSVDGINVIKLLVYLKVFTISF